VGGSSGVFQTIRPVYIAQEKEKGKEKEKKNPTTRSIVRSRPMLSIPSSSSD
jgi:hypothetical protein